MTILVGQTVYGQLRLGARVGVNYSDLKISDYHHPILKDIQTSSDFGYEFGFYARANVMKLYIQPEIILSQINGSIKATSQADLSQEYKFRLTRLDVPFPVGFKQGPVTLLVGPVASFNLNSGAQIFDNTHNYGTWSIMGGIGLNFGNFMAEFRYESALSEFAKEAEIIIGDELYRVDMDMRTSQFILTLGYTF